MVIFEFTWIVTKSILRKKEKKNYSIQKKYIYIYNSCHKTATKSISKRKKKVNFNDSQQSTTKCLKKEKKKKIRYNGSHETVTKEKNKKKFDKKELETLTNMTTTSHICFVYIPLFLPSNS